MKKTIIICLLSLVSLNSFSQKFNGTPSKDDYLKLSKKQRTTGWILLGGGTLFVLIGASGFNSSYDSASYSTTDTYGFIMLGGVVMDLISIPFFVGAANNKRKAATLSFHSQHINIMQANTFLTKKIPSITVRIKL